MTAPQRPVVRPQAGLSWLLIAVSVVLFIIAAIIAFSNNNFTDAQGVAYVGLACLGAGLIAP